MATAFPRGKRRPPPSAAPASSSERPSKKTKDGARDAAAANNPTKAREDAHKDDFLFGSSTVLETKPKQHTPPAPHHSVAAPSLSNLPLGGGAVLPPTTTANGKRLPPKIEPLSFSKYAKGTKVLGVIREVSAEYAVVSLGCRLNGFVRRDAFNNGEGGNENGLAGMGGTDGAKSPPLTKVLPPPGSLFAFYVLSTESEDVSKRQQRKQAAASGTPAATKKRRIELSPWPREVNSGLRGAAEGFLSPTGGRRANEGVDDDAPMVVRGAIASIEDHGCLVDLGGVLGDKRAFLRFDAVEGGYALEDDDEEDGGEDSEEDEEEEGEGGDRMDVDESNATSAPKRPLNVGRVFDFALLPSHIPPSNSAIVQLSLPSNAALAALRTPSAAMPSLAALQPGMLTPVNVEAHARNGLCVSFHEGVYRGSLDEDHLGGHKGAEMGNTKKKDGNDVWWRGVFKGRHSKFVARIIAVDAATKVVRFSLNPHVLGLDASLAHAPRPVGTVIEHARVVRVDPGLGALLALPGPNAKEDEEGDEGDEEGIGEEARARESRLVALDRSLGNGLLSVPAYRAASRVATAYVHISKSMDVPADKAADASQKGSQKGGNHQPRARTPESLFARHFAANNRIKALRVLGNAGLLDGVASCATAPSIVKAHVLTHADVVPGRLYQNVPVVRLLDGGGILVDLGCGVRGVVPAAHLFDKASHGSLDSGDAAADGYRQKIRAAKYKIGTLISVRCLTVDPAARTCVLTAKKALVANADLDPIIDYASVQVGRVAAGYISKVDGHGLTVTFCNNVHGRASGRSLARELGVEDCRVNYAAGDVVLARAVACERRRNRNYTADDGEEHKYYYRLTLSLKTAVDEAPDEALAGTAPNADGAPPLAAGAIIAPKRMKVVQLLDGLARDDGHWRPGYAVVSVKSKCFAGAFDSDAVECRLPYDQLRDSHACLSSPPAELDAVAREALTVGKRIDAAAAVLAVPYHYGGSDALPVVSLKPSLVATVRAADCTRTRQSTGRADNNNVTVPSDSAFLACAAAPLY